MKTLTENKLESFAKGDTKLFLSNVVWLSVGSTEEAFGGKAGDLWGPEGFAPFLNLCT